MKQSNISAQLSRRQTECLQGVADHLDSAQIGAKLGISQHTVDGHIAAAVAALNARSRRDAVRIAELQGILDNQKLTGGFPPVVRPLPLGSGEPASAVRDVDAPPGYVAGPPQFPVPGTPPRRGLVATFAMAIVIAVGMVLLLIAVPQLAGGAEDLANILDPPSGTK